jgi:hypothetical protein
VLSRTRELSPDDRLSARKASRDVPLEEVVQPLALGQDPEASLNRRFCHPPHMR